MNVSSENKKLHGKSAVYLLAEKTGGAVELSFCPRCGDRLLVPYKQDTAICYSCGHGGTLPLGITHAEDTLGDYHQVARDLEERRAA